MAVDLGKQKFLSFDTDFEYLRVVASGEVSTDGTVLIPVPDGIINVFYRVFYYDTGKLYPVLGFFSSGAEAHMRDGNLEITSGGGGGGSPPTRQFTYFIYGSNG